MSQEWRDVVCVNKCKMRCQRKLSAWLYSLPERQKCPLVNSLDMLTMLKIVRSVLFCMMERQMCVTPRNAGLLYSSSVGLNSAVNCIFFLRLEGTCKTWSLTEQNFRNKMEPLNGPLVLGCVCYLVELGKAGCKGSFSGQRKPALEGMEERIKKLGDIVPEMLFLEQVLLLKVRTISSHAARCLGTQSLRLSHMFEWRKEMTSHEGFQDDCFQAFFHQVTYTCCVV